MEAVLEQIKAQKDVIAQLKTSGAEKEVIAREVEKLKALRAQIEEKVSAQVSGDVSKLPIKRDALEDLLKRRFFISPSFSIYGGVGGLYDYGPPACAVKANMLAYWRQHFVLEENMLELDLTNLTPDVVLRTSGHVERFNDFMVKDVKTGDCYRADKLLHEVLEKMASDPKTEPEKKLELASLNARIDDLTGDEMGATIKRLSIKAPDTGNDLSDPFPFNLMFSTSIGPAGNIPGFLRPETAQGIFVNFRKLLDYNGGKMPFAGATIGTAFRNEIAPRSGLLRVREFTLAEIEHFVNPADKKHPKFKNVADLEITLFPRDNQTEGKGTVPMRLGDAVSSKLIDNETLGYFVGRVYMFLMECGCRKECVRFRQHLSNEMAHYASDCWDAEILTSYGWVESVGIADRACFDLKVHTDKSKVELVAYEEFPEPRFVDVVELEADKGVLGKTFRKESAILLEHLNAVARDEPEKALALQQQLEADGKLVVKVPSGQEFEVKTGMIKFKKVQKKEVGRNFLPGVIEPSFGIGRILYGILEHAYYVREGDEQRAVLGLSPTVAPYKCSVLPLSGNEEFQPFVSRVSSKLAATGLSYKVDDSSQPIGRRYARTDEIGIPFAVTVDFTTVADNTVTLRERDSCTQVRMPMEDVAATVQSLVQRRTTWEDVRQKYPEQHQIASELIGRTDK